MIETYCDACGTRLDGAHESDAMAYFQYTPETSIGCILHFCPTCSINMAEDAEKAKVGKHGES